MRKLIVRVALLAAPFGGWAGIDHVLDARYERPCVKHFSDDSVCATGYAPKARQLVRRRRAPTWARPARRSQRCGVRASLAGNRGRHYALGRGTLIRCHLLVGAIGAVQGANQGNTDDVVKGAIIGALSGSLLSLLLFCAALARRPGILEP